MSEDHKSEETQEEVTLEVEVLPEKQEKKGFAWLKDWAAGEHDDIRVEDVHSIFREHTARTAVYGALGIAGRMSRTQALLDQTDTVEMALNGRIPEMTTPELLRLRDARSADLYRHLSKMAPDASKVDNLVGQSGMMGGALAGGGAPDATVDNPIPPAQREKLVTLGGKIRKSLVALAEAKQAAAEGQDD